MDSGSQHLASNMTPRRYNFNSRPRDVNPNKNYKQLNSQPHKSTPLNRNQNMLFYPFVFLPERMRTACDRSGATGKERDEETGYGYLPRQARQAHHGARYMDHELMTGWLSVDPLAPSCPSFPQPLKNIFAIPKSIRIFAFRKNKEE